MFDGIGKLTSGDYEIRGGREGKIMVGFAIGAMLFIPVMLGGMAFYFGVIQKQNPIVESVAFNLELQRQYPMIQKMLECDTPKAKGDSSHMSWSCTGYCGSYDLHTYEKLPDGTEVAICAGDFNVKGKST